MAKIKINNLPEGFEFKDGKLVENMQSGGMLTGDQSNYGLVTTNPSMDVNDTDNVDVRYSLSKIPRDQANIEAEGGETVLTDLNGDGQFGLYDIKGPRHANGGVPMYLPEQSFVYSDYNKLKFTKDEMAEMGIESGKRKTPAKISKKFGLNEYYAKLKDPYADKIQRESAELMMDKNKMKLSKLAFMQESKKKFEDGVPFSSYPYLMEQGIDPLEFTQQVEQLTAQQAQEKMISSLPPEQQMQIRALQEYMQQVDNQQMAAQDQAQQQNVDDMVEMDDQMINQNAMQQMPQEMLEAMYGTETLPLFQSGSELTEEEAKQQLMEMLKPDDPEYTPEFYSSLTDGQFSTDKNIDQLMIQLSNGGITRAEFDEGLKQLGLTYNDFSTLPYGTFTEEGLDLIANQNVSSLSVETLDRFEGLLKDLQLDTDVVKVLKERLQNGDPDVYNDIEDLQNKIEDIERQSSINLPDGTVVSTDDLTLDQIGDYFMPVVADLENKYTKTQQQVTGKGGSGRPLQRSFTDYDMYEYNALQDKFDNPDPEFRQTLDRAYESFKQRAKENGIAKIPSKQELFNSFLRYQQNNYMVGNIATEDERFDDYLDKAQSIGLKKNEYTQRLFDRLKRDNPEYGGYKIDEDETKANQLFFQVLYDEDQKADDPTFDVFQYGPEQTTNWDKNRKISRARGFYGNNFLNQFMKVKKEKLSTDPVTTKTVKPFEEKDVITTQQGVGDPNLTVVTETTETKDTDADKLKDPSNTRVFTSKTGENQISIQPGNVSSSFGNDYLSFYLQDQLKTNAIANRQREMFLPFQPVVTPSDLAYVIEDPTRAIAALNEQYNIGADAIGAFAGPQQLSARLSANQGKAAQQIANTIASVNQRNVNTINRGEAMQSRMNLSLAQEERKRLAKLYDDTQVTLQNYMNELNFDREQYADALSNMYTNAANAFNLNQLYDNFSIDPSMGGKIVFDKGTGAFQRVKPTPTLSDKIQELIKLDNELFEATGQHLSAAAQAHILGFKEQPKNQYKFQQELQQIPPQGYISYTQPKTQNTQQTKQRKGSELKRYAVPFYAGTMYR